MAANRRIRLRSTYATSDEARASAVISPGMSMALGTDGRVAPGVGAPLRIAEEDALQGRTVDDAYAVGDVVFYFVPLPGDHANVLLANLQNIAIGDLLVAQADGTFIAGAGPLQAVEALNNASGTAQLIRAEKV